MANNTTTIVWLHQLLSNMDVCIPTHNPFYHDSLSAIKIADNHPCYEWMKHIKIDSHFIQQSHPHTLILLRSIFRDCQSSHQVPR